MRVPVVEGDEASEVVRLLRECGHEAVLIDGTESAIRATGGVQTPPVVVLDHAEDRRALIRSLRDAGAWVIGAALERALDRLADADDLLPLPANVAALRARLRLASAAPVRGQSLARRLVTDRLVSVGTLAKGVAHEINNPLAVTMANVEFALEELDGSPARIPDLLETKQALREALEGARRVGAIVKELRTFARTGDGSSRRAISVTETVERALTLASGDLRHRARIVRELADVPLVEGNEQLLGQIVINLLSNAAHAIPEGASGEHEIRVRTAFDSGRVLIEIADTGAGIPREDLPQIFDPFFTTKPPGQGTGLGLALCHNLVTGMGGQIGVESTVGVGTTVRVHLPPAEDQAARELTPVPLSASGVARRARILLVDDEPMLARTVERILAADHEVVAETDARVALARIAGGERFDVILCDLMMPEMSGIELHGALGAQAPEQQARMLFMTGGAFTPAAQQFIAELRDPWVSKPFEAATLRAAISSRLS